MKKLTAIVLALALLLTLTACGKKQETETTESAQLANPWTDVNTAAEAAKGADVESFELPDDGAATSAGAVKWTGYRWMRGLAQAKGTIGSAELTVRKGFKADNGDISGDYNEYTNGWTVEVGDCIVYCYGNAEGKAMKACWENGAYGYSLNIRGQGDDAGSYGVADDVIYALVTLTK